MRNAFTIDLEDWFCSHNLSSKIAYEDWDNLPGRVEKCSYSILNMLEKHNTKATFFILGWVADRYPELMRSIAEAGHEIASHGYSHRLVTELNQDSFIQDVKDSVKAITNACGVMPRGYRAPAFTVVKSTLWALDSLKNENFVYDSSIYPVAIHPDYGISDAPLVPYQLTNGLTEVPLSSAQLLGKNIPCSGGAYLRFLPYSVYRELVKKVMQSERSLIFYIHPWEIDPDIPKVKLPLSKRIRHYTNLSSTMAKMERLLNDFEFTTISQLLKEKPLITNETLLP